MCVDFTDLNNGCLKDSYPLSSINILVYSASRCSMLNFMDAFLGYNQIQMHPIDEDKTAFMTETTNCYYKVMSFFLKNVDATYQRLMDKILEPLTGRIVQAYVDDMVVTSREFEKYHADLEQFFKTINKYHLKLNLEKYVFGVKAGRFLRFHLTKRGIEANPDK